MLSPSVSFGGQKGFPSAMTPAEIILPQLGSYATNSQIFDESFAEIEEDRFLMKRDDVWIKLCKEVHRTFLYVDTNLRENKNWLNSPKCDINDL